MSLVLKSNQAITSAPLLPAYDTYKARVLADGGVIKNESLLLDVFLFMKEYGLDAAKVFSATSANWGIKEVAGNVTKLYNLFDATGDIVLGTGTYPLQSSGNKFSLYSAGSAANKLQAVGTVTSKNLSIFLAYEKGASTTVAASALAEFWGVDNSVRGLNATYAHNTGLYGANAYGTTGAVVGVPYAKNIGASVTPSGLKLYQNGAVVGSDLQVTSQAEQYLFVLASANAGAGAQGNYYATIAAHDLTQSEELAISKFVADFI
ncbi:hypothetical protein FCH30_15870 [Acinetobacter radioresistens]|uniref:hypothetical protein n=1 Tax=Acinetobacter radioresistens TaxID=40216 RepID=UPI00157A3EAE|nr:hypothetical protein [Acinetobacter radioresistens]NTY98669.1 hypothetical protein [Acinetobacter radioresistens]